MRVAIGAVLGVLGGPATYARELVRALAALAQAELKILVFTDAPTTINVSGGNVTVIHAPLPASFAQPLWDHVVIPRLVRRHRPDLYHGTKGVLPGRMECRQVVTIHDLAVYHCPASFAWLQRLHQRWELPRTIRHAARVIADSAHARQDIANHFSLPGDRVVAVPLGVTTEFHPTRGADDAATVRRLQLPPRYILYAGTIQPRKNVEALVDAFVSWGGPADWQLVIAGRVRPGYRPAFVDRPPSRVRYLGTVSDSELATLYRHALALVSPSAYEGFGLSLLEAMACGCVVVAGGNSAAVELVNGVGLLLDRLDSVAIRAALDLLAANDERRAQWRQRGLDRAGKFRWEHTARATWDVYRTVMDESA
ncbi:MAG: glycosyltransferase family 4 protein [Deltaproteobacteria bacterium]|nr:glycosyltransferase family 4 protein [Deltaproteobacteria bacterium]MBI3390805.1 glycosyltransferase family 4 protein [Deltaproteobacteria bacterium]